MTRKSIRKIPGYYGCAIRGNVGDAGKMKKAIMAIWKHEVETTAIAVISVILIVVSWTGQTESL